MIREARPEEGAAVGQLRVDAYVSAGFMSPDSDYLPELSALGQDDGGVVLVAVTGDPAPETTISESTTSEGGLAGTTMIHFWPDAKEVAQGPGEAEIRALAVSPLAQGQGIGRALLHEVLDRTRARGVEFLVLSTQREMVTAHHLYEKAGFRRLPERDWSPRPGLTLLVYGLDLRLG